MSIPTVLLEHFQELQALYGLRKTALRSAEWFLADIADLDQRIATHVDGLLSSAELSQSLLADQLGGDDPDAVFAAAYVLLRLQTESAADRVWHAFQSSPRELQSAFVEALALAPLDWVGDRLKQVYQSGPALTASAAAEVFARRGGQLSAASHRLDEFLKHDEALVRRAAWRIVALIGRLIQQPR